MASKPPPLASSVAVRWVDGRFYFVRFLGVEANGSRIQFADGKVQTVPSASVIAIPAQANFHVNDQVLALWQADRMFPGTITGVSAQGYTVAWHGGDPPRVVPPGTLTYLAWASAAPPVPPEQAPSTTEPTDWLDVTDLVLEPADMAAPADSQPLPFPPMGSPHSRQTLHIFIPGTIMPVDRGIRFVEPLERALNRSNLGSVIDEGTELVEVSGKPTVKGCWITVEVSHLAQGNALVRATLKAANAPPDTTITPGQGA